MRLSIGTIKSFIFKDDELDNGGDGGDDQGKQSAHWQKIQLDAIEAYFETQFT